MFPTYITHVYERGVDGQRIHYMIATLHDYTTYANNRTYYFHLIIFIYYLILLFIILLYSNYLDIIFL